MESAELKRTIRLVVSPQSEDWVQAVRDRYDPQADHVAPFLALLVEAPASKLPADTLDRLFQMEGLPSLRELSFGAVGVTPEGELWLLPEESSNDALQCWYYSLLELIETRDTRAPAYLPHILLGKCGNPTESDAAMDFAIRQVSLPIVLKFDTLAIDEFSPSVGTEPVRVAFRPV